MDKTPTHIGFIMDGNGRWATKRGLPRSEGHRQGVNAMKNIIGYALEFKIPYVTVFAFSVENMNRPKDEIDTLMGLVIRFGMGDLDDLKERGVRIRFLGLRQGLSKHVVESINRVERETADGRTLTFNIAFNYSGTADIIQAVNRAVEKGTAVDEEAFKGLLYTCDSPFPDAIVRTGGEKRLSNFMLYQAAYSELIFSDVYWPDFGRKEFTTALAEYAGRKRRFGRLEDKND